MKKEDYEYMWKKLKKSLEEVIESDYAENKEIYKIMLGLMKAEEDEDRRIKMIESKLEEWLNERIEQYYNDLIKEYKSYLPNKAVANYLNNKIEAYTETLNELKKLKENKNGSN